MENIDVNSFLYNIESMAHRTRVERQQLINTIIYLMLQFEFNEYVIEEGDLKFAGDYVLFQEPISETALRIRIVKKDIPVGE